MASKSSPFDLLIATANFLYLAGDYSNNDSGSLAESLSPLRTVAQPKQPQHPIVRDRKPVLLPLVPSCRNNEKAAVVAFRRHHHACPAIAKKPQLITSGSANPLEARNPDETRHNYRQVLQERNVLQSTAVRPKQNKSMSSLASPAAPGNDQNAVQSLGQRTKPQQNTSSSSTTKPATPAHPGREYVQYMLESDVLFFQGSRSHISPGTALYLRLVKRQQHEFGSTTSRKAKAACKRKIMEYMHQQGARFFREERGTGRYYRLTEKEVLEAISHSLWYANFKRRKLTTTTTASTTASS